MLLLGLFRHFLKGFFLRRFPDPGVVPGIGIAVRKGLPLFLVPLQRNIKIRFRLFRFFRFFSRQQLLLKPLQFLSGIIKHGSHPPTVVQNLFVILPHWGRKVKGKPPLTAARPVGILKKKTGG